MQIGKLHNKITTESGNTTKFHYLISLIKYLMNLIKLNYKIKNGTNLSIFIR